MVGWCDDGHLPSLWLCQLLRIVGFGSRRRSCKVADRAPVSLSENKGKCTVRGGSHFNIKMSQPSLIRDRIRAMVIELMGRCSSLYNFGNG
ncbi:hypothetical protein J6590_075635 [Homalodisca vitripennis]|nr:hypothetical protein J6590_075635 [Homalodisca vitripennis]